jgi:P27 family predicted phage terminase small subunit
MPTKSKPKPPTRRAQPSRKTAHIPPAASPAPDPLPPPPFLSQDAAQVWRETVAHLAARGPVDVADAVALETFVAAVIRQRRIMVEIESAPLVTAGKISPLLRVAEATAATVKNLGHVLGLNPVARQRLPKPPQGHRPGGGGKWGDLA